jgi:putative Ca2+/H+ antiporter (TMEM165/GDT1 family)
METILVSLGTVAFAEIGDKTQLLAILLAARFRAPLPIILGIFVATALNHSLAALLGVAVANWLSTEVLSGILAVSFLGMAAWALLPDSLGKEPKLFDNWGPFGATLISFFLIEIGDKTQLATMALAARYHDFLLVAVGTTLGMLVADVPAVYLGEIIARKVPLKWMRLVAAAIFLVLGIVAALDWGRRFLFA